MKEKYSNDADFLAVYVREAHPTDGWRMADNDRAGIALAQPKTLAERSHAAGRCGKALKITMPMAVDTLDDKVGRMYSGLPDRLYVIDKTGRVTYRSARGPFGFLPGEMEQALVATLIFDAAPPDAAKGK